MRTITMAWPAAVLALTALLTSPAAPAAAAAPAGRDFNGDGYNDLAVGTPAAPGPNGTTGAATILYGGPGGIGGHTVRRPAADCRSDWNVPCRGWGTALAAGDLDGDSAADLVLVGVYPKTQIDSWKSGSVKTTAYPYSGPGAVLGSALSVGQFDGQPGADVVGVDDSSGFEAGGGTYPASRLTARLNGADWTRNAFHDGWVRVRSMATGDVHGSGRSQMAVIISKYTADGQEEAPYLWLLDDLTRQPASVEDGLWAWGGLCTTANRDVLGCPKKDSRLAMGDVDGDGHLDVVMATPSSRGLQIWYGSAAGFSQFPGFSAHDIGWFDAGAMTGQDLAVGDVNGDGAAEIVLGAPKAASAGRADAGAVVVVPGSKSSPRGPVLSAARIVTQDGMGSADPIGEQSQAGDLFGASVRVLDVTGDGKAEVVVGAPAKNGGAGMLVVLRGSASGVSDAGAQVFHPGQFGLDSPQTAFGGILPL
uniref:FG-GAP-like repeat-containing protein n=1 Tax=Nonomuraea pusilla TaxID=46177 RepID=UPI0009E9A17E|nr:FG-GAP-like repeat-containing protein [Nonomuraea pusilla]